MIKRKSTILAALILGVSLTMTGCSEADKVNYNMSKQADYFECERKITVYNARTDKIINAIRLNLKRTHINNPVRIKYTFYEPNRKRDLDNIAGVAHKFIQDALVKCKVLDNDGWNNIVGFEDHFFIDKHNPRIEVVLEEVKP